MTIPTNVLHPARRTGQVFGDADGVTTRHASETTLAEVRLGLEFSM